MDESHDETKEVAMSHTPLNIFEGGGAGMGGGLGAGLLGGILGGALLGGRGLFGAGVGADVGIGREHVTPMQLQTATGSIIDANQNTVLLQAVGDVKAAVPLAEAQVQLALAQSTGEIRSHIGNVENTLVQGQTAINSNVSNAIAASLASQNNLNVNILTQGSQTRDAINAMGVANLTATANSTKEILAALNEQNMANLQRQLAVAESALLEQRAALRTRETEINITNTNTATAQQIQTQAQQQQQFQILAQLTAGFNNLANDIQAVRQTQSQVVFGNNVGSGQAANATNNSVR